MSSDGRLPAIDGLRASAMLMVYTYHVWQFSGSPQLTVPVGNGVVSFGALINTFTAGVDLFMVLSGFCLFWPICQRSDVPWSATKYYLRRIRRIVPPYYAAIVFMTILPNALVFLMHLTHKEARWQPLPSMWQYVTHLTFTHTLFPSTWDGIQGAFWSLGLEAQFYVVFPLIIVGFRRLGMRVALILIVSSLVYRVVVAIATENSPWVVRFLFSVTFLGRWMQFAAGMIAASIVQRHLSTGKLINAKKGSLLFFGSILAYIIAVSGSAGSQSIYPVRDSLLAISYAMGIVSVCASRTIFRVIISNKIMASLGIISYSIFLLHQNIIYYVGELMKKMLNWNSEIRFMVFMTLGLVFIIAISALFFRVFELPFLRKATRNTNAEGTVAREESSMSLKVINIP